MRMLLSSEDIIRCLELIKKSNHIAIKENLFCAVPQNIYNFTILEIEQLATSKKLEKNISLIQ